MDETPLLQPVLEYLQQEFDGEIIGPPFWSDDWVLINVCARESVPKKLEMSRNWLRVRSPERIREELENSDVASKLKHVSVNFVSD